MSVWCQKIVCASRRNSSASGFRFGRKMAITNFVFFARQPEERRRTTCDLLQNEIACITRIYLQSEYFACRATHIHHNLWCMMHISTVFYGLFWKTTFLFVVIRFDGRLSMPRLAFFFCSSSFHKYEWFFVRRLALALPLMPVKLPILNGRRPDVPLSRYATLMSNIYQCLRQNLQQPPPPPMWMRSLVRARVWVSAESTIKQASKQHHCQFIITFFTFSNFLITQKVFHVRETAMTSFNGSMSLHCAGCCHRHSSFRRRRPFFFLISFSRCKRCEAQKAVIVIIEVAFFSTFISFRPSKIESFRPRQKSESFISCCTPDRLLLHFRWMFLCSTELQRHNTLFFRVVCRRRNGRKSTRPDGFSAGVIFCSTCDAISDNNYEMSSVASMKFYGVSNRLKIFCPKSISSYVHLCFGVPVWVCICVDECCMIWAYHFHFEHSIVYDFDIQLSFATGEFKSIHDQIAQMVKPQKCNCTRNQCPINRTNGRNKNVKKNENISCPFSTCARIIHSALIFYRSRSMRHATERQLQNETIKMSTLGNMTIVFSLL